MKRGIIVPWASISHGNCTACVQGYLFYGFHFLTYRYPAKQKGYKGLYPYHITLYNLFNLENSGILFLLNIGARQNHNLFNQCFT